MKKGIIKIFAMSVCAAILVWLFTGCTLLDACSGIISNNKTTPEYKDKEVGDFAVRFYDDYCEIIGTTEQGNSKRFLVVPAYIDGVRVDAFGCYSAITAAFASPDGLVAPEIDSQVLEKIYFETAIKVSPHSLNPGDCPNLSKVMYLGFEELPYYLDRSNGFDVYYARGIYEENIGDGVSLTRRYPTYPANISYYYNYESAPADGYYWIDDCDYGGTIEFIPPEPEREGYTFGGWYKEPECINEWDFATDTLPEEKTELKESHINGQVSFVEMPVYQETILYAKWTKQTTG